MKAPTTWCRSTTCTRRRCMYNLRRRYFAALLRTLYGDDVHAVNPYKWLDLYSEENRLQYAKKKATTCPRIVYAISAMAYDGVAARSVRARPRASTNHISERRVRRRQDGDGQDHDGVFGFGGRPDRWSCGQKSFGVPASVGVLRQRQNDKKRQFVALRQVHAARI